METHSTSHKNSPVGVVFKRRKIIVTLEFDRPTIHGNSVNLTSKMNGISVGARERERVSTCLWKTAELFSHTIYVLIRSWTCSFPSPPASLNP